jgi:hypothetical protein
MSYDFCRLISNLSCHSASKFTTKGVQFLSGANPTFASYNASVVNFYNATGSLVRFINKRIFVLHIQKRTSLLQRWRYSCKFKKSVVRLAPGYSDQITLVMALSCALYFFLFT